MTNKKIIIFLSTIALLFFGYFGYNKYKNNTFPEFNTTKKEVVLYSDADEGILTEQHVKKFNSMARAALGSQASMTNFDDDSLYVRKEKGKKGKYFIRYVCESANLNLRFSNDIHVTIDTNSVKNYKYDWYLLTSELWDFMDINYKD